MKTYLTVLITFTLTVILLLVSGITTFNVSLNELTFEQIVAIGIYVLLFYIAIPYMLYVDNLED